MNGIAFRFPPSSHDFQIPPACPDSSKTKRPCSPANARCNASGYFCSHLVVGFPCKNRKNKTGMVIDRAEISVHLLQIFVEVTPSGSLDMFANNRTTTRRHQPRNNGYLFIFLILTLGFVCYLMIAEGFYSGNTEPEKDALEAKNSSSRSRSCYYLHALREGGVYAGSLIPPAGRVVAPRIS